MAIPLNSNETNISRPTVFVDDAGIHHMWYSRVPKGRSYQIGYARSLDGVKWVRMDTLSGVCAQNLCSGMQAYPHVFSYENNVLMLFNDGNYGDKGFLLMRMKLQ